MIHKIESNFNSLNINEIEKKQYLFSQEILNLYLQIMPRINSADLVAGKYLSDIAWAYYKTLWHQTN